MIWLRGLALQLSDETRCLVRRDTRPLDLMVDKATLWSKVFVCPFGSYCRAAVVWLTGWGHMLTHTLIFFLFNIFCHHSIFISGSFDWVSCKPTSCKIFFSWIALFEEEFISDVVQILNSGLPPQDVTAQRLPPRPWSAFPAQLCMSGKDVYLATPGWSEMSICLG